MQTGGSSAAPDLGLKSAIEHNPAILDDQSTLEPHGEKLKRGPNAPEFNPNAELVDVTTEDLREHHLAEAVQADHPLLDDQTGTPYHAQNKAGGASGGLQGGGHGL